MATERQIAANRLNGLKGGVKTAEGKAISRLNARKHGIFATALTECASDGFSSGLLDELNAEIKPVGIVEQLLVDKLAVTYLRMRRCAEAESLHFRAHWKFNPANFGKFPHNETVVTLGQYDARLTNQFLRLLRELGQRQEERTAQRDDPHGSAVAPLSIAQSDGASWRAQPVAQISSDDGHKDEQHCSEGSMQNTDLDSRLRGNDEVSAVCRTENTEVDSRPPIAVEGRLRGNDEPQAGAPVPQKMENEPNSGISECPPLRTAERPHSVPEDGTEAGGVANAECCQKGKTNPISGPPIEEESRAGGDGFTGVGLTAPAGGAIFDQRENVHLDRRAGGRAVSAGALGTSAAGR